MPIQYNVKDELAEPTRALIRKLWEIHRTGGGQISLKFLFNLFSGTGQLPQNLQSKLDKRDDIKIEPTNTNAGRFKNIGTEKINADIGKFNIKVPEIIEGDYVSNENEFRFIFDSGATILGCTKIIIEVCVKVERLVGNQKMLNIDITGDSFDQYFVFTV